MPEFNRVNELVVNKVDSYESFKAMKELGLINPAEVYIVEDDSVVLYSPQNLTEEQKAQVRANIGVSADTDLATVAKTGSWNDLNDKPFGYYEYDYIIPELQITSNNINVNQPDNMQPFENGDDISLIIKDHGKFASSSGYKMSYNSDIDGYKLSFAEFGFDAYIELKFGRHMNGWIMAININSNDFIGTTIAVTTVPKMVCMPDEYLSNTIARTESVSEALNAAKTYTNEQIAGLVDTAPDALNTLNELASALGDDPNFATTVLEQVGKKVEAVEGKGLSTNDYTDAEQAKLATVEEGATATSIVIKTWTSADMLCTMSISGLGTYNFEYGMTLRDWVESPYNTDGVYISGNYAWSADGMYAIRVTIDTVLEDGKRYSVVEPL